MPFYRIDIFFIILLFLSPLCAQNYLQPEAFPVENGLSSQHVNCLAFDTKGYLWVGTQSGLKRYDGYHFTQFQASTAGQISPNDQQIKVIRTDLQGNVWILSEGGLLRQDQMTGEISSYSIIVEDSVNFEDLNVKDIYPGKDGEVWALTDNRLISMNSGKTRYYSIPGENKLGKILTTCLLVDGSGNIWVGTSVGLLFFDRLQQAFTEYMPQNFQGLLSDVRVNCLFLDADNRLWIGTRNGLNRFDPVDYDFDKFFPGRDGKLQPSNEIHYIRQEPGGRLILFTAAGLYSFDIVDGSFAGIAVTSDRKLTSIATDAFGTVWCGTTQGLLKIRLSQLLVQNFTTQEPVFRLPDDRITSIAVGTGDNIFIGFANNTYDIADLNNLSQRNFETLDGSRMINFFPFRDHRFIVLSEHEMEIIGNGQTGRTSFSDKYPFVKKSLLQESSLTCLLDDGISSLWLGTDSGLQLIRFDSARHRAIHSFSFNNQSLDIGPVYDIESDADQNLWLGTANGLVMYDPKRGSFYRYTPYDKTLLNTEHKKVYFIMAESPGLFLIGTSRGAYRFDIPAHEFTAVIDDPLFLQSPVRAMAVDNSRNIWIGTGTGLYCISHNSGSSVFYDQREGLINYAYSAICKSQEGQIYLGGQQGLSVIDPDKIKQVATISRVNITGLRIIGNEPLNDHVLIHVPDTLVLPWVRKPIKIDFASMNLSRPEFNKYRYSFGKSEQEPEWHPLGSQNYVILDQLSPGNYSFMVSEADARSAGDANATSLLISVASPKWRSKTALVLYIITGMLFIAVILRVLTRQFFNLSKENAQREMFAHQIMLQKEELSLKNKSITDSINYAKRIQTAMLPPNRLFKSIFSSSFVLYLPKDIVSGDFYWINKLNDKIYVAAVDCTGHGVPGAFMSIIGFELFRKITNIEGLSRPSDILNRLNEDFHVIFKDVDNVVLRDGMDVAFCSIDKKNMILEFAGAFNPLYLIRDNKITEIKGDRYAIGLDETNFMDQTFKNHLIPIQQGDIIYIFTDGFADQFGGSDGKKYKYRRFRHLLLNLHHLPMERQHEILENNVLEWRGTQEQVDDILVIGIKIDF
jgi:ligand-binding sensor domain-containing protein/serine phosphatase RsbU (regulator of sigma subunit)